jgi:co-chaperonin GroES (HSP10)
MKIKNIMPFDDKVLVIPDVEKNPGRILIPEKHKKEQMTGTILKVGPAPSLKKFAPGMKIMYSYEAGDLIRKDKIEDSDRDLLLVPLPDILGVVSSSCSD